MGGRMKKAILILVVVLFVALVGGGVWFWNAMQQPLYEPGMVRAGNNLRAPLVPPAQSADKNFWTVESDIKLFHFADGAGTNVLVIHGGPGVPFTEPLAGLKSLANNYRFHYYDQRGSGKSSRPIDRFASSNYYENMQTLDRTLGLGAQIADIERIRQILGDEKIILVGHSFGGFIADRRHHKPDQLSGGQQQRVAIARAFVTQPSIVLADEPTGNLDSKSGEEVLNLLRRSCDELGQTIVMVTHDPKAASYADRVVFLKDGRIVDELKLGGRGETAKILERLKALE